jgi:hypothetical protein
LVGQVLYAIAPAGIEFSSITPFTVWNGETRAALPPWVQWWIIFMVASFAVGLLFVRRHASARWVVGAFVLAHIMAGMEILIFGPAALTVGLIALNHALVWTPAGAYMAKTMTKPRHADFTPYAAWRFLILGVIAFSLVFDYRDAAIYLFGERPAATMSAPSNTI